MAELVSSSGVGELETSSGAARYWETAREGICSMSAAVSQSTGAGARPEVRHLCQCAARAEH